MNDKKQKKQTEKQNKKVKYKENIHKKPLGSIQIEPPELVRRKAIIPAYISIDLFPINPYKEKFTDIVDYENNFKFLTFCEYFSYHFLFFFLFGPFLPIFLYPFCKSFIRFQNMCFIGCNSAFFSQMFVYICNMYVIFAYFYIQPQETYSIEIFALISSMILRISVISVKYAHFSDKKLDYIKNVKLTFEEIQNEFIFSWVKQSDLIIDKEIYQCILKTNVDTSAFRMFFLKPLKEHTEKMLEINFSDFEDQDEQSSSKGSLAISKKVSSDGNFDQMWRKAIEVVKRTMLFTKFESHEGSYSGYMVARFLIKANKKLTLDVKGIAILSFLLAVGTSIIPSIFRYFQFGNFSGEDMKCIIFNISILILNIYLSCANFAFLIYGVVETGRTEALLSQLSNLLSPKRVSDYYNKKSLPTLNIFCPISYKCWLYLNQIFRSYGEKYYKRIEFNLGIFLFYNLVLSLTIFLAVFGVIDDFGSTVDIAYLIAGMIIMFLAIFFSIYKGAVINDFYDLHRDILKANKNILSDFTSLYYVYFENPNFESDNEIYYHGATIYNKFFETTNLEEKKKNILSHCQNLLKINNDIIEELAFSKERRPFKIFGIAASMGLLKSLLAGLGTILAAILQKSINK